MHSSTHRHNTAIVFACFSSLALMCVCVCARVFIAGCTKKVKNRREQEETNETYLLIQQKKEKDIKVSIEQQFTYSVSKKEMHKSHDNFYFHNKSMSILANF